MGALPLVNATPNKAALFLAENSGTFGAKHHSHDGHNVDESRGGHPNSAPPGGPHATKQTNNKTIHDHSPISPSRTTAAKKSGKATEAGKKKPKSLVTDDDELWAVLCS